MVYDERTRVAALDDVTKTKVVQYKRGHKSVEKEGKGTGGLSV
jgi:hypothetical protein